MRSGGLLLTFFDMVFDPLQQLLPAQVPLMLAPVVVLHGHVGVIEGGGAQGAVLVRVLGVHLCAGRGFGDRWVQRLHAAVAG